jgi:hypothetical protein
VTPATVFTGDQSPSPTHCRHDFTAFPADATCVRNASTTTEVRDRDNRFADASNFVSTVLGTLINTGTFPVCLAAISTAP